MSIVNFGGWLFIFWALNNNFMLLWLWRCNIILWICFCELAFFSCSFWYCSSALDMLDIICHGQTLIWSNLSGIINAAYTWVSTTPGVPRFGKFSVTVFFTWVFCDFGFCLWSFYRMGLGIWYWLCLLALGWCCACWCFIEWNSFSASSSIPDITSPASFSYWLPRWFNLTHRVFHFQRFCLIFPRSPFLVDFLTHVLNRSPSFMTELIILKQTFVLSFLETW